MNIITKLRHLLSPPSPKFTTSDTIRLKRLKIGFVSPAIENARFDWLTAHESIVVEPTAILRYYGEYEDSFMFQVAKNHPSSEKNIPNGVVVYFSKTCFEVDIYERIY